MKKPRSRSSEGNSRVPRRKRSLKTSIMPKDYNKTISQEILVLSRIKKAVSAAVCAIRLREECEDCIQEAVVRFLQRYREVPGRPFSWYLTDCCWFVRDFLKQGRSLDSPKRRTLRQSIDSENIERVCSE